MYAVWYWIMRMATLEIAEFGQFAKSLPRKNFLLYGSSSKLCSYGHNSNDLGVLPSLSQFMLRDCDGPAVNLPM